MSDAANVVTALNSLHNLSITVAMDDFGTGYSSHNYTKRFRIDIIKIARSFVADVASDPNGVEIVKAMISMARSLDSRVVAKGVETHERLDILRNYDCDEIQGFLFSPPRPGDDFTDFLRDRVPVEACPNSHLGVMAINPGPRITCYVSSSTVQGDGVPYP